MPIIPNYSQIIPSVFKGGVSAQKAYSNEKQIWPTPFDPLSIAWDHAFWADDPDWTPPADGAAVTTWRNAGLQGIAATQATSHQQPVYRANYANLNGNRVVEFDGDNDHLAAAGATVRSQPNHIVAIGYLDATGSATIFDSTPNRQMMRNNGTNLEIYAGGTRTFGSPGTGPFIMMMYFNSTSSSARFNGTVYDAAIVGNIGADSMGATVLVGGYPGFAVSFDGGLAFVAAKNSALTFDEIVKLEAWAALYYGVPV